MSKIKYVDPETAVHPYRQYMGEEDWARVERAIESGDVSNLTDIEIAAMADAVYDTVAAKIQTHEGVTTLQ